MPKSILPAIALAGLAGVAGTAPTNLGSLGKGVQRVTSDSKRGRSMTGAKGSMYAYAPVSPHNQQIEERRQADLAARKARRAAMKEKKQ